MQEIHQNCSGNPATHHIAASEVGLRQQLQLREDGVATGWAGHSQVGMKNPGTGPCGLFQLKLPFLSKFLILLFLSLVDCYVTTTTFEFNLCYVAEAIEQQSLVLERGIYFNLVELYYEPSGLGPDNLASIVSSLAGRRPFFRAGRGRSGVQLCTRQAICLRSGTGHSCRDALFPLRACLCWSGTFSHWTLSNNHAELIDFITFPERFYRIIPASGRWQLSLSREETTFAPRGNVEVIENSVMQKSTPATTLAECNLEEMELFKGNHSLVNNYDG